MRPGGVVLAGALLLVVTGSAAHRVSMVQDTAPATRLSLSYADGSPFAYESYELYSNGAELPVQVGRTDARGRVVFIPERPGEWRIKAFSEDGHGLDNRFTVAPGEAAAHSFEACRGSPLTAMLAGVGILFGLFGLFSLLRLISDRRGKQGR